MGSNICMNSYVLLKHLCAFQQEIVTFIYFGCPFKETHFPDLANKPWARFLNVTVGCGSLLWCTQFAYFTRRPLYLPAQHETLFAVGIAVIMLWVELPRNRGSISGRGETCLCCCECPDTV